MRRRFRRHRLTLLALMLVSMSAGPQMASAADVLRVGRPQADSFSFVPLDVGIDQGIFKRHGLEIETTNVAGDAKLQQAMAADAVDVGLGSGPAMAFIAKGVPALAIAAQANQPLLLVMVVQRDGPIKTVADLKGKRIAISTAGSLPEWLVRETSRQQGWGPDGIDVVALGVNPAQIAALKTKQVDGMVASVAASYKLADDGTARTLATFGNIVSDFHIGIIYATDKAIAAHPDDLRNFLAGWFETIAFLRQHKDVMVKKAAEIMNVTPAIASRTYDDLMPMFSADGRFNPKALAVLARSFVETGELDHEPDMSKLYTTRFLPN
ncbi:MAG TPA: ABC transporter substrate-binding protein [Stellaceae bacterium]|nr:ABC transporter substrate-binding protein [Stellaceae bacterium]